ncbi:MAG: NAD-binding protein, partial [Oscillospiraceae bacterium]|nr:NAD-binding protein [Oscillospiraceae bacterium]
RHPVATADGPDLRAERVLKEENIERTDAAVMLTDSDEENLILSMYAASLHVPQILTLVDHLEFGNLLRDAGNQMISPKQICADIIVRYVRGMQNTSGSSVVALHHLTGGADALEFNVTSSCRNLGTRLRDIRLKPNILIACINRRGNIIIPGGMDTLERGDMVIVIAGSNRVILDLNDIFDSGD